MDYSSILIGAGALIGNGLLLALRDWRDGKFLFKRNETQESNRFLKETRDSQMELQHHFNDETTVILKDIRIGIERIITKQDDILINGVRTRK